MMNTLRRAGIVGTGMAVPERILSNRDLEQMVDTTDDWITSRTGIRERRIADPDTASSDLGTEAAKRALAAAELAPEELDLIVVATITPDHFFPATACIIQDKLGAVNAAAFDLSAGCSGFVYALDMACRAVSTGAYNNVLVVGVDVLSKIVDWTDRSTCVLFGDGSGAAVVRPVKSGGLLASTLGADGKLGQSLIMRAGGSRLPASAETVSGRLHFIEMAGNEVFKFAVRVMGSAAEVALQKCGISPDELDLFIPHQANTRIIDAARKRLGLPPERVYVNVDRYGNTSAGSVGIALDEVVKNGLLKPGDKVALVGFGAGLTWAAAVLEWTQQGQGAVSI